VLRTTTSYCRRPRWKRQVASWRRSARPSATPAAGGGDHGEGRTVQIDIPCDIQQVDDTGYVWTFLDEARDLALVIARVLDLVPAGVKTIVHLEVLPGDPTEYAEALSRAHLLTA